MAVDHKDKYRDKGGDRGKGKGGAKDRCTERGDHVAGCEDEGRAAGDRVDLEALGRAVKEAQYRHHRALDTRLAEVGTTLAQWDALRAIARAPGASAHELALATFQGDQAFGTLASRLAAQHLIERRPGRGRRIEHHLTEAGERVLKAGRAVAVEVLTASFAPLDEDERATLLGLLRRIGTRADALP